MPMQPSGRDLAAELRAARSILCVQPHYDDNDIGAGGTLAALADGGAAIHYVTVSDDLMGVLDATLADDAATWILRSEQVEAARYIGVHTQQWLGYPDAGTWDVVALRTQLIEAIRRHAPDFVFTCDPWLRNEAHRDHVRTGIAAAKAVLFRDMPRFRTKPEIDEGHVPHPVRGLVLYFTIEPDLVFDIDAVRERKHRALDAYRAQFTAAGLRGLHAAVGALEARWAATAAFTHGEALRLLRPDELHVGLAASLR